MLVVLWLIGLWTFGAVMRPLFGRRISGKRWSNSIKRVCALYSSSPPPSTYYYLLSQMFSVFCVTFILRFIVFFLTVSLDIFRNQQLLKEYKDFWGNTKVSIYIWTLKACSSVSSVSENIICNKRRILLQP